jgi:hypothetical protein
MYVKKQGIEMCSIINIINNKRQKEEGKKHEVESRITSES